MVSINSAIDVIPVPVANGGTGAATLTGVLTGNGTSAVTANAVTQHGVLLAGASNAVSSLGVAATGTVLAGSTGADPAFTGSPSVSGSLTAATTVTATLGNITATNGNVIMGTAGNGLVIKEGSNARSGVVTLASGDSSAIANTSVTANTRCQVTRYDLNGSTALGELVVTLVANTSLQIKSISVADGSTVIAGDSSKVNWLLYEAS